MVLHGASSSFPFRSDFELPRVFWFLGHETIIVAPKVIRIGKVVFNNLLSMRHTTHQFWTATNRRTAIPTIHVININWFPMLTVDWRYAISAQFPVWNFAFTPSVRKMYNDCNNNRQMDDSTAPVHREHTVLGHESFRERRQSILAGEQTYIDVYVCDSSFEYVIRNTFAYAGRGLRSNAWGSMCDGSQLTMLTRLREKGEKNSNEKLNLLLSAQQWYAN